MSRQDVYDAVTNWMSPPNVVGLNAVVSGAPVIMDGGLFRLDSQQGWGAYGFTHIEHSDDVIFTFGGNRRVLHEVVFLMLFQQLIAPDFDVSANPAFYLPNLTTMMDSALTRLRSDHTIGTQPAANGVGGITISQRGALFQAGTGDMTDGSLDLVVDADLPVWDNEGGKVWSWNSIKFNAIEMMSL